MHALPSGNSALDGSTAYRNQEDEIRNIIPEAKVTTVSMDGIVLRVTDVKNGALLTMLLLTPIYADVPLPP
jgi:hypothetical protein